MILSWITFLLPEFSPGIDMATMTFLFLLCFILSQWPTHPHSTGIQYVLICYSIIELSFLDLFSFTAQRSVIHCNISSKILCYISIKTFAPTGCVNSAKSSRSIAHAVKSSQCCYSFKKNRQFGIQSRPIQMRAAFLYLTNRWMNFKMLLKPNGFIYLVMV